MQEEPYVFLLFNHSSLLLHLFLYCALIWIKIAEYKQSEPVGVQWCILIQNKDSFITTQLFPENYFISENLKQHGKREIQIKILLIKLFVYSFRIIDTVRYMYRYHSWSKLNRKWKEIIFKSLKVGRTGKKKKKNPVIKWSWKCIQA